MILFISSICRKEGAIMAKALAQIPTVSVKDLPKELFVQLDSYIQTLDDKKGSLIHILHRAQHLFGYLPKEVMLYVARKVDLPAANVFGVVSFYSFFTTNPVGEHTLAVCMGTACFVRGAEKILDEFKLKLGITTGETTPDDLFTLKDVRCVGACGLAPIVIVGEKVYGRVKLDDVDNIINDYVTKDQRKEQ
jgi:NADH-quinone oxidoreductase subunit E/NADP-reducing hydrogenase subunit HndA